MEKRPPLSRQSLLWWDPHALSGGHHDFAKPKPLAEARWGRRDPQAVPRPFPSSSVPPPGCSRTPFLPVGLARRSWGVSQRGPILARRSWGSRRGDRVWPGGTGGSRREDRFWPGGAGGFHRGDRALVQDVARAPQLHPPGCRGARAGALPVLAPSQPLPPTPHPGTCINCSYFPSLTALLLVGTNCESPQGPPARPARDVPPPPQACATQNLGLAAAGGLGGGMSRSGGGCPGWSKEAMDTERCWSPFPLGTSVGAFCPRCVPQPGWPRCPAGPRAQGGGPVAVCWGAGERVLLPRLSGCLQRWGGLAAGIAGGPGAAPEGETPAKSGAEPERAGRSLWILLVSNRSLRLSLQRVFPRLRRFRCSVFPLLNAVRVR